MLFFKIWLSRQVSMVVISKNIIEDLTVKQ